MHCCHYCVQTDIGKNQTQFRPKKILKFRPTGTHQPDAFKTTFIL